MIREVFCDIGDYDEIISSSRASNKSIIDRLWLDSNYEGDRNYFTQRFSGFFIPPVSSLYTFNIRSDDSSCMRFSNNTSRDGLDTIINVPSYTER